MTQIGVPATRSPISPPSLNHPRVWALEETREENHQNWLTEGAFSCFRVCAFVRFPDFLFFPRDIRTKQREIPLRWPPSLYSCIPKERALRGEKRRKIFPSAAWLFFLVCSSDSLPFFSSFISSSLCLVRPRQSLKSVGSEFRPSVRFMGCAIIGSLLLSLSLSLSLPLRIPGRPRVQTVKLFSSLARKMLGRSFVMSWERANNEREGGGNARGPIFLRHRLGLLRTRQMYSKKDSIEAVCLKTKVGTSVGNSWSSCLTSHAEVLVQKKRKETALGLHLILTFFFPVKEKMVFRHFCNFFLNWAVLRGKRIIHLIIFSLFEIKPPTLFTHYVCVALSAANDTSVFGSCDRDYFRSDSQFVKLFYNKLLLVKCGTYF